LLTEKKSQCFIKISPCLDSERGVPITDILHNTSRSYWNLFQFMSFKFQTIHKSNINLRVHVHAEKVFIFPLKSKGVCSYPQVSFWLWTKQNFVWFIIKKENCWYDHILFDLKGIWNWSSASCKSDRCSFFFNRAFRLMDRSSFVFVISNRDWFN